MSCDLYSSERTSIQASRHAAYVNRSPDLRASTVRSQTSHEHVFPAFCLSVSHAAPAVRGGVCQVDCVLDLTQYFIISRKIGLIDMTGSAHKADQ